MKNIQLPADTEFVRFDPDVGRLLAIAEYPDESMLPERMKHDWRIGTSLLSAVRQGHLRVRDCQTRFPLEPDAPSVDVLLSLVSVGDFREFVADLGYDVHVGGELEESVVQVASIIQSPEVLQTTPAHSAAHSERAMKKKALIEKFESEWPTISADLSEMSRNGLKEAAHAGQHGHFFSSKAREWAVSQGKIRQTPISTWSLTRKSHRISD